MKYLFRLLWLVLTQRRRDRCSFVGPCTSILGWDERSVYIEQRFERAGERVAEVLLEGRFLARDGGHVSIADVLSLAGNDAPSPALPPHVSDWVAALHAPRKVRRAA